MSIGTTSSYYEYSFGHSSDGQGAGIANTTNLTGTNNCTHHADGPYQTMRAGSTAGNGCTVVAFNSTPIAASNNFVFGQDVDITLIVRTVEVTDVRIWFAFVNQNTRIGNNDFFSGTADVIAFRYSTGASDSFWTGFCQNGSSGGGNYSTTAVGGGPIAASTQYTLRIRKVSGTVYFSVDGGTEVSISTHVPTSSTSYADMSLEIWTVNTGATHTVEVGRISCTIG